MRLSRILLAVGCLGVVGCIGLSTVALLVIAGNVPNKRLNPIEGVALQVQMWSKDAAFKATLASDATPVRFTVAAGDTANGIAARLASQGLIADADAFRTYVRYYGLDANLQAGVYLLYKTQTLPQIARALTNAGANSVRLLVREGWRIEEIVAAINQTPNMPFSGTDFLALVRGANVPADFLTSVGAPPGASLEGFLFPATYELPLDAKAGTLLDMMLKSFNSAVDAQARADLAKIGLTVYQAVTLASIVEREAVVADERPLIAGVYLNRLRKPMTLDADPTIQYALGNTRQPATWWPNLTQADYRSVVSPYNTYLNQGLPPSPIASPRRDSILAVIYERQSPYFYFRASCNGDGRHNFAETFDQQLANGCP